MKMRFNFILCAMLLAASMVFAAGNSFFSLNLQVSSVVCGFGCVTQDSVFYLKQEAARCGGPAGPAGKTCVQSVKATPDSLYYLLEKHWIGAKSKHTLRLESNIDLGEISADGSCAVNHKPLPFRVSNEFYGDGKKITNLCYHSSKMSGPVGLFESIDNANISNFTIENVRIIIDGESEKGEDYYPVGALVGRISLSSIDKVKLSNVQIDAPFAGALVGVLNNSTVKNSVVEDGISIINNTKITSGFAGSKVMGNAYNSTVKSTNYGYGVFLGGIAGVSVRSQADPSFKDTRVNAVVQNIPADNNSALGGVVGMMAASFDSVLNVTSGSQAGEEVARISGGSAMGGLVGFAGVLYENGSQQEGSINIIKSSFNGEISDGSVGGVSVNSVLQKNIFAGGLVGRDSLLGMSRLLIKNSQAELSLKDSLKVEGIYRYAAGGIIGASNRCLGGDSDTIYVSIKESRSQGNIRIAGSAKDVDGLHVQAFVGGIAGDACFATNGDGLSKDTSSVNIDVRTKTAYGDLMSNGFTVFDSVVVGGVVGFMNSATAKALPLTEIYYDGAIEVADSLNTVVVGGVVGTYPNLNGGKAVDFNSIFVRSENLIKLNAVHADPVTRTYNDNQVAKIGGVCGICRELHDVSSVAVVANITAEGTFSGDTLLMGGMVGQSVNVNEKDTVSIVGAFSVGNILVNATMEGNSKNDKGVKKLAYLVADQQTNAYSIKSCYHYGEDDLDVGPFGGKGVAGDWTEDTNIKFLIRNGDEANLNASYNGVQKSADVKKESFAGLLNSAFENSKDYIWSFDKDYYLGTLPFLAHGSYSPTIPEGKVSFKVTFLGFDDKQLVVVNADPGSAANAPDVPEVAGYTFVKWDKDFSEVTGDLTVRAIYEINSYTVTFLKALDDTISTQLVEYGKSAVVPSGVKKIGHTFTGWDSDDYKDVKSDITVYAKFTANVHQLVYMDDEDGVLENIEVAYGSAITLMSDIEKAADEKYSYTFVKWVMEDGSDVIPATMPDEDVVLKAVFKSEAVMYKVVFQDFDGTELLTKEITYEGSVETPADPSRLGYKFIGWSSDEYKQVKADLVIKAKYEQLNYAVVFEDYDGDTLKFLSLTYGAEVTAPAVPRRQSTEQYDYTFKGWTPAVEKVTDNVVYVAEYDSSLVKYTVSFVINGTVYESQVEYGQAAVAPEAPVIEGLTFVGWDSSYTEIVGDLKINAIYDTIKYKVVFRDYKDSIVYEMMVPHGDTIHLANSMALDRKATEDYVYSFKGWSEALGKVIRDMNIKAVYDSTYIGKPSSSASEEPASSSSNQVEVQIVSPKFEQSGNAIRLSFKTEGSDEPATVTVLDELGMVIATATVTDGYWEMVPAPKGKSYVTVEVGGKVIYQESYEVKKEVVMQAKSWQMVSVVAMDESTLSASEMNFYWWDELNPVGEYWQYRSYRGGPIDETRGYWVGSAREVAIPLREVEVSADAEIQWKLDNKYSGWNLVANPYGWYVDLSKGKTEGDAEVIFWHWDSELGAYCVAEVVGPYEAVWVRVDHSTVFSVKADPDYNYAEKNDLSVAGKVASMRKGSARKASADNWSVVVALSDDNGKVDSWNILGAGSSAETLDEPPSGMGDRVNLSIRESAKGSVLAKSIKAVASEYEWILDLSANTAREGKLTFEGVDALKELGYVMYVTVDGETKEVTDGKSLNVALKQDAKQVQVRVAARSDMAVASAALNGFKVLQNAGSLQVGFNAADALAGANGHYALVSVNGKSVARGNFAARAGQNVLDLQAPKSGLYFMQVKVGSQTMNAKVMVK